jgi:sugar lactone lactonase YvrE
MSQMRVQSISTDPSIQTYRSDDKTGRNIGCMVMGILLFVVFIVVVTTVVPLLAGGAAIWSVFSSEDPFSEVGPVFSTLEAAGATVEANGGDIGPGGLTGRASPTPPKPAASPTPSAAELILSFGSLGIAPGQLNDARAMALDPQGNIYVADRDSGRLQIFNDGGQVQTQWTMSEDRFIDGMTIDRAGHLYTIESSDIFRYDLATGQQLNQINYPQGIVSFNSVAATVNNEIVAVNWIAGQIIRFDANGSPNLEIAIENVPDGISFDFATVDGQGNIYAVGRAEDVLGDQQDVVFKFTAAGQYVTRFGKSGGEPGSFRAPQAIAVDGQGRIYVGDIFGVHIFDNTGSFLDFFEVEGAIFDMKFDDQGELLITNREKIFKFAIHLN